MNAESGPRVIVGFGASSMQGTGDSGGGCVVRAARATASSRPPVRWVNRGIGGNTTVEMLRRAEEVRGDSATHLIVMLGCNDLPRAGDKSPERRTSLPDYEANLDRLLPVIRAPRSLFVSSFAVCPQRTRVGNADFARYMEAAMAAARRHGYEVWDLYHQTQESISRFWADDGLHLRDEGHQFIADQWVRWVG